MHTYNCREQLKTTGYGKIAKGLEIRGPIFKLNKMILSTDSAATAVFCSVSVSSGNYRQHKYRRIMSEKEDETKRLHKVVFIKPFLIIS